MPRPVGAGCARRVHDPRAHDCLRVRALRVRDPSAHDRLRAAPPKLRLRDDGCWVTMST